MFEVEQKFILSESEIENLTKDAEFLGEKKFTDIYFDTKDFNLTKNDMWLRKRGEQFELKLPMHVEGNKTGQQYQEIEGEDAIREIFAIAPVSNFEQDIFSFGYEAFCNCQTTRRKFKKGEFVIDLDIVSYGDFVYRIGEIELMVDSKEKIPAAIKKIEEFAEGQKLEIVPVRGKVIEYLKRKKPLHYAALLEEGVVTE